MSRAHKARQRAFYKKHGILGEMNITVEDFCLLERILQRLRIHSNRVGINLWSFEDLLGNHRNINPGDIGQIHNKVVALLNNLRARERGISVEAFVETEFEWEIKNETKDTKTQQTQ